MYLWGWQRLSNYLERLTTISERLLFVAGTWTALVRPSISWHWKIYATLVLFRYARSSISTPMSECALTYGCSLFSAILVAVSSIVRREGKLCVTIWAHHFTPANLQGSHIQRWWLLIAMAVPLVLVLWDHCSPFFILGNLYTLLYVSYDITIIR